MTVFVESPWPTLLVCLALQAVLGYAFLRSGRAWVLGVMALVLAATVGMVLLERAIVTDTEQVEDTLHGIAELLEANDAAGVLAAFAPSFPRLAEVRSALADVTIESASVGGDLEVRVNRLTSPPTATAFFTGRIDGHDRAGASPYERILRKFKVRLEWRQGRWLIVDYEDASPVGKKLSWQRLSMDRRCGRKRRYCACAG